MPGYRPEDVTFKQYVPAAYGKTPETPVEVIEAAACLLEEEGRWKQGNWFDHHNTAEEEYEDNPFCNGWSACADGALQLVSIGAQKRDGFAVWRVNGIVRSWLDTDEGRAAKERYGDALRIVERHLADTLGFHVALTAYNDSLSSSRDKVVAMLRAAADGAKAAA